MLKINDLDIFDFVDYRDFLQNAFNLLKEKNAKITLGYVSLKLNYDKSSLIKLLHKKRHLPKGKFSNVVSFLSLSAAEERYFGLMLSYAKTMDADLSSKIYSEMMSMRPIKKIVSIDTDCPLHQVMSMIIMTMLSYGQYSDLENLANDLGLDLPLALVEQVCTGLLRQNLIGRDSKGVYVTKVMSSLIEFQKPQLDHLHPMQPVFAKMNSIFLMSLPESKIDELMHLLNRFSSSMDFEVKEKQNNKIYALNLKQVAVLEQN